MATGNDVGDNHNKTARTSVVALPALGKTSCSCGASSTVFNIDLSGRSEFKTFFASTWTIALGKHSMADSYERYSGRTRRLVAQGFAGPLPFIPVFSSQ